MNEVGAISIFCVFDWLRDQNVSDGTRVKVTLIRTVFLLIFFVLLVVRFYLAERVPIPIRF